MASPRTSRKSTGGSSRPSSARDRHSHGERDALERSLHRQDESFIYECKAAYLTVVEDVSDNLTSRDQLVLALQQSGRNPLKKNIDKYWKRSTENLSFDSFCEICKKEAATTEDDLMKSFKKIDVNGDGFISHSELYRVMTTKGEKMSKQEVRDMIDEVDENKDGKLDYKEFCKMLLSTAEQSKKAGVERLERREKRKAKRPSSARRDPSPRTDGSKERTLKETPKPSPRIKRSTTDGRARSPVADKKIKIHEPKNLASWKHLHSKGTFIVEDHGSSSHQYSLHLKEDSNVWITMHPTETLADTKTLADTMLYVLRSKEDPDGKRLVTFTEQRDHKGRYSVRCDLEKGTYHLLPFTTGCRLWKRKSEPNVETKLLKKDKDDKYVLTKAFKDALSDIFDMVDLDGSGTLSREEFNWYNVQTSGEDVADDEWEVVEENVELRDGELTKKGFLQLNQMEAEDNEGDTEDLWVTLNSMGYNKGLVMDEACPFVLNVYLEDGDGATLKIKSVQPGGSSLSHAVCESVINKGEAVKVKGARDILMYVYQSDFRTSLVMDNQSKNKVSIKLDCSGSKNCISNHTTLNYQVDIPPRGTVIGHHLLPKDENLEWTVLIPEAEVK